MARLRSQIVSEMAAVRAALAGRADGTPNLRDFYGRPVDAEGRDDFEQYTETMRQYHAETAAMHASLEALAVERNEAIARERAEAGS